MFPNALIFQFIVNATVMVLLFAIHVYNDRVKTLVLLGNTFVVNYLSVEGLKFYSRNSGAEASITTVREFIS